MECGKIEHYIYGSNGVMGEGGRNEYFFFSATSTKSCYSELPL